MTEMAKRKTVQIRPRGVPAQAVRQDNGDWLLEPVDAQRKSHGLAVWWRSEGVRYAEVTYAHGIEHGPHARYHDSGDMSRKGTFVDGKMHGVDVLYRSSQATQENLFAPEWSNSVWRVERHMQCGVEIQRQYFDHNSRPVTSLGVAVPGRPRRVPKHASFESGKWYAGQRDGNGFALGRWQYWTPTGDSLPDHQFAADDAASSSDSDDAVAVPQGRRTLLFGEDGASDWLDDLEVAPRIAMVERAIHRPLRVATQKRGHLDVDDCHAAVAAAGALAQIVDGKRGPLTAKTRAELAAEFARKPIDARRKFLASAHAAVLMVLNNTQRSELRQLYDEDGDSKYWITCMKAMLRRLANTRMKKQTPTKGS
jgi:hypothetical protein